MSSFASITMLATLRAALAAAQDAVNPSCTSTHTPTSFTCCDPVAGVTATSYANCNGCALSTIQGPQCRCTEVLSTLYDLTTTQTACSPSVTPHFETRSRRQNVAPTTTSEEEQTWTVPATCFTTATYTANGCGGQCEGIPVATATASVDCGGCGLVTTIVEGHGICVCPTATTLTACLVSPTA